MPATITLPAIPEPGPRLAVQITKDAMRHVRRGHPWIYDDSINSVSRSGSAGDLAVVFDDRRKFAAIGLYDPNSPIRIKVLHAGKPAAIDSEWWSARVAGALSLRAILSESDDTTGYRILNGENDGFPGLVVDQFDKTLTIKVYTAAWFPHLTRILEALRSQVEPNQVVLRLGRLAAAGECFGLQDGQVLLGSGTEPVEFLEHGLRFLAHPITGQKTGFFLDQRDNRNRVREIASGARVLDVFSCTGGFSVAAAAGGAREVTSVDLSGPAMETAELNMALNESRSTVKGCKWDGIVGDAFEVMARLASEGRQFDLIIVDPPSFAQRQANVSSGLRAYGRLTELAIGLLGREGRLVQASCSSRITADDFYDQIQLSARRCGVDLVGVTRTGHGLDHPVTFAEGAYLKAVFARVERHQ